MRLVSTLLTIACNWLQRQEKERVMTAPAAWMKRVVPQPIRHAVKEALRARHFADAMARYRTLGPDRDPPVELITELVSAWGNPEFSAKEEYLIEVIRVVRRNLGPVLECGSGLSTLLMGVEAQRLGQKVYALEHHPEWLERMRREVELANTSAVELLQAPIKSYGDFAWYDPPLERLPTRFALVICDGPPGETPGGRYGLLPVLRDRLGAGSLIILDDYEREEEQAVAARWVAETGATLTTDGKDKPFATLRLPQ